MWINKLILIKQNKINLKKTLIFSSNLCNNPMKLTLLLTLILQVGKQAEIGNFQNRNIEDYLAVFS